MVLLLPIGLLAQDQAALQVHVVQRGENLFRIALQYGLSTDVLAAYNGITNSANIQVGQRLLIPSTATVVAVEGGALAPQDTDTTSPSSGEVIPEAITVPEGTAAIGPEFVHPVVRGETVYEIARQYGTTVNAIATLNALTDVTLIYVGQPLIIPGVSAPVVMSGLPAGITNLTVSPMVLVEGKTGQIHLAGQPNAIITGELLGKAIQLFPEDSGEGYVGWVGVPIFTEPGVYPMTLQVMLNGVSSPIQVNVQVVAGNYGNETIMLTPELQGLLTPVVEDAENSLLEGIISRVSPTRYFSGGMSLPAAASITSRFGTRRAYNGGGFDRYHSGVDFAGVPGTPIVAPAAGQVVMADTLNVRGRATVIDHGWGVYTGYWHQNEILVQVGDFVETGQVIGMIGSTGRVTGAHLHWELWVNGVAVDPMQWVQQSFG
jgi:murein DD-endopeptidase MepM/ murein hydrolase activator NlpD